MATRVKTVEFATQTVITTLGSATNRELSGATSIFIPETGVTFKNVTLMVECTDDNGVSAVSLTAPVIAFKLGTAAYNSTTGVNPLINSAEESHWTFVRNITSVFAASWTGTSMTWNVQVNFTGPATCNHAAKILITYQYDDTATTQIKTIRIPIESTRTLLTTSFQTVGGAQAIPAITGTYLPESSVTVRQVFVELWFNTGAASNATFTVQARFNGATTPLDVFRQGVGKNSAEWGRGYVNITGQQYLSGSTSMECVSLNTTNRICTIGGMIVVTYEFNANTSTTIYNSLMLGGVDTSGWIGGTTSADQGVWERNIYIEEPDTITLKESGLCLYQNDSAGYTFNIRCSGDTATGVQTSYQAYINTPGTLQCGCYSMVHRIDSGGQNGKAGISLKRGKNLYRVCFYSGTAQAGWNLSGYLLLNYTSGKHSDGVGIHSHSVYQNVTDFSNYTTNGARVTTSAIITPYLPETNYYLMGLLYWVNYSQLGNAAGGGIDFSVTVSAEIASTDTVNGGDGWVDIYNGVSRIDAENMNGFIYAATRTTFSRWNGDPDPNRLNFKTGRRFRLDTGPLWTGSMGYWYTYNATTYIISGVCSGYIGDGSGIDIDIFRVTSPGDYEQIADVTTSVGGSFSFTWIDNTDTLFCVARENDTSVGRSSNGVAG